MFSDDVLERIFTNEKVKKVPIIFQSIMIRAVEEALEEEKEDKE